MSSGDEFRAVQHMPGSNHAANTAWQHSASSGGHARSSKSSGRIVPGASSDFTAYGMTQMVGEHLDDSCGRGLAGMPNSSSQTGIRAPQQQPGRPGPGMQVSAFHTGGQAVQQAQPFQSQHSQQRAQHLAQGAGSQVYGVTNGTRVVKAGQPYPNTTIVRHDASGLPVPGGQDPLGMVGVHAPVQGFSMPSHVPGVQMQGGTLSRLPHSQLQHTKMALVQPTPLQHVVVAQAQVQSQMAQPIGPRPSLSSSASYQSAIRPGATTVRHSNGPFSVQTVYAGAPVPMAGLIRPAVRIPKLATVATYNPVTGVRSATTSMQGGGVPGSVMTPALPAGLPASLVQQMQEAHMLQQQQAAAGGTAPAAGIQHMVQVQLGGPQVLGGLQVRQQGGGGAQRQTTLLVSSNGIVPASQAPGAAPGASHAQSQIAMGHVQPQPGFPSQLVSGASGSIQQVVTLTLADGTSATTVMDQATLLRMLSESARGQAVKVQVQSQQFGGQALHLPLMPGQQPLQQAQSGLVPGKTSATGSSSGADNFGGLQSVQLGPRQHNFGYGDSITGASGAASQILIRHGLNNIGAGLARPPPTSSGAAQQGLVFHQVQVPCQSGMAGPGPRMGQPQGQQPQGQTRGLAGMGLAEASGLAQVQGLCMALGPTQQPAHLAQHSHAAGMANGLSVVDLGAILDHQQQRQSMSAPPRQSHADGSPGASSSTSGQYVALSHDEAAAASVASASLTGTGDGAAAAALAGGAREDLKLILVSIGQELARHGISVETAVTSGWLGVLTATDVAVLADAYAEEERCLPQQQHGQVPLQQMQLHPQYSITEQQQHLMLPPRSASEPVHNAPSGPASELYRACSVSDRAATATAAILALTNSSARTSVSVAASEDGNCSSAGGDACAGAGKTRSYKPGGGSDSGLPSLPFSNVVGGSGPPQTGAGLHGNAVRDAMDGDAAALADVFGERHWVPMGLTSMAEEAGLTAQGPPGVVAADGSRPIDSASEYEAARRARLQGQAASGKIALSSDCNALVSGHAANTGTKAASEGSEFPRAEDEEMVNRFANLDLGCGFY